MKEATDPKLDGFMRVEEIVQHLASGWGLYQDDGDWYVQKNAGRVRSDTLSRLIQEGWIERLNVSCRLTDAGHKAYLRSGDEMGDGKLIPPSESEEV